MLVPIGASVVCAYAVRRLARLRVRRIVPNAQPALSHADGDQATLLIGTTFSPASSASTNAPQSSIMRRRSSRCSLRA